MQTQEQMLKTITYALCLIAVFLGIICIQLVGIRDSLNSTGTYNIAFEINFLTKEISNVNENLRKISSELFGISLSRNR